MKVIHKLFLCIGILIFLYTNLCAQSRQTLIRQLRQLVGQPDTTGQLTNTRAREFLNQALREFSAWGTVEKRQILTGAAGRDTFQLSTDFLFPISVEKTLVNRSHKVGLSPIQPDSASFAFLRNVPNAFLFERTDTIVQSTTVPNVNLPNDVFEIRGAYRKDLTAGGIKQIVRISADSVSRIATTPSDYFYFAGQPFPRVVFGKKASFGDTVFVEVLAIIPRYFVYDVRGAATDAGRRMLHLFPPMTRADSIYLVYASVVDSVANGIDAANWDSSTAPMGDMEKNLRPALIYWCAASFYRLIGQTPEADFWEQRWREILGRWAIARGLNVPTAGK